MEDKERKPKKDPRDEELDRIWDIDALLPTIKTVYPNANTDTAELILEPKKPSTASVRDLSIPPKKEPERHFIPPHTAAEERALQPDEEYVPENALIRRVRLYRWKSNYHYYEDFVRDAVRLYPIHGEACPRVPFFSYVPQYSQMSRSQLEWYLWWREQVRRGEYPETDYSYVLLYAYEMINLAGKLEPLTARNALCGIWEHYRDTFHQLDSYLPEWICDVSLIHRLPPPVWENAKLLSAAMERCRLREFYVTCGGEEGYARALLAFCSNYDYHKSKFCTKENKPLFDRAVLGVLCYVTEQTGEEGKLFSKAGLEDSKMLRDAYTGALCSYRNKRKIEVEYCSFSRSHELRFLVTDLVKYTENRLRGALGIRSRLTVYALPKAVKDLADHVLRSLLPAVEATTVKKKEDTARYEALYDLPRQPLSFAAAAEIEKTSWQTTERLVEAFEEPMETGETIDPVPAPAPAIVPLPTEEPSTAADGGFAPYLDFIRATLTANAAEQKQIAAALGKPIDVIADEINELAADAFGDVLLEDEGNAYVVLEDYRDVAETLLRGE